MPDTRVLMTTVPTKTRALEADDLSTRELCIADATPGGNQRRRLVPANPGSATRPALRLDDLGETYSKVSDNDKRYDAHRERCGGRRDSVRGDDSERFQRVHL